MSTNERAEFLQPTEVVDYQHPDILGLAESLSLDATPIAYMERCFNWVRDNIRHSIDFGDTRITVSASEVLRWQTGLCYSKTHLLAALLRAKRIACGFAYQRLALDESATTFCLHGLNGIWIPEHGGWYLADPRGNRPGIDTRFAPPQTHLAFKATLPGEGTLDRVYSEPLPVVLAALRGCDDVAQLCDRLPDDGETRQVSGSGCTTIPT